MSSDDDKKRPAVNLFASPNKSKKFGRRSSPASGSATPGSTASNDPLKQSVHVTVIKPTNGSTSTLAGIVISPMGFMADKFLGDILAKKATEHPKTAEFLNKTGAIPFIIYALDENGNRITKMTRHKFYPIQSAFVPLEDTEVASEETVKKAVRKVGYEMYKYIQDDLPSYYSNKPDKGASEMPQILDWKRDVRTVSTFSEAIADRMDDKDRKALYMTLHLSLKSAESSLNEWSQLQGDNNLYSIFEPGKIDFHWFHKRNLPFECLNNNDKTAFKEWCDNIESRAQAARQATKEEFDVKKHFGFDEEED